MVLCERGELEQLVHFPYIDLEADVVAILESRARSVDLSTHNFYDLLYSFHIFRHNYRKGKFLWKSLCRHENSSTVLLHGSKLHFSITKPKIPEIIILNKRKMTPLSQITPHTFPV